MWSFLKRTFGEEFNSLLFMNLITVGLSLTVVGIGPAVLAMTGTLVKINDSRCQVNRIAEYFHLLRKKFWKGVLFEVLLAGYVALLVMCQTLAIDLQETHEAASTILMAFVFLGFLLAAAFSVCVSTVLSCMDVPFFEGFWDGILLALSHKTRAVLAAVCVYGLLYLLFPVFWPVSALFYVVIMFSVMCALKVGFMWVPLKEHFLDNSESAD